MPHHLEWGPSVPGTTLPRTVRNTVRALTCVMWALASIAAFAWDTDSLIVTLTLAAVATGAQGFLYLADKIDALMSAQRESVNERHSMMVRVIEEMACGPVPEPEAQGKTPPNGLRAVS